MRRVVPQENIFSSFSSFPPPSYTTFPLLFLLQNNFSLTLSLSLSLCLSLFLSLVP
jgi:hypothetical protein